MGYVYFDSQMVNRLLKSMVNRLLKSICSKNKLINVHLAVNHLFQPMWTKGYIYLDVSDANSTIETDVF